MPYAIGNAEMVPLPTEWPGVLVSFDLGPPGKVRKPFLGSSESSDLVQEMNLIFSILVLLRDLYMA
jgi:hypothetical protein